MSQVKDAIKHYSSEEYFSGKIQELEQKGLEKLNNPLDCCKNVTKSLSISEEKERNILNYFVQSGDFTAFGVRAEKIDDFDTRDQLFFFGRLVNECGRIAVNSVCFCGFDRTAFINRLAQNIHDASQCAGTDGNVDGRARVGNFGAADQTISGVHGDGAHSVFTQVLGHFEHQRFIIVDTGDGVQNRGHFSFTERDVDNSA
jgi:hypothetical protein